MKRALWIFAFALIIALAYVVPYTLLKLEGFRWFTYPFWCVDALVAMALMFHLMRRWRD